MGAVEDGTGGKRGMEEIEGGREGREGREGAMKGEARDGRIAVGCAGDAPCVRKLSAATPSPSVPLTLCTPLTPLSGRVGTPLDRLILIVDV